MKAAFYAIVGAVISGILLIIAQNWLQNKPLTERLELGYAVKRGAFSASKEDLVEISKKLPEISGNLSVDEIVISNDGNLPLDNQQVVVRVGVIGDGEQIDYERDKIYRVGTVAFPGSDPDAVATKIDGSRVLLNYRVLNPGEQHRMWIAYNAIGSTEIGSRRPGLSVKERTQSDKQVNSDGDTFGDILFYLIIILVPFIIGAVLAMISISSDLKKRGHDLDALMKSPKK